MATIQGKYTIIASLNAGGTLEAGNRNITFSVTDPERAELFPDCINAPKEAAGYAIFNSQNDIKIKRVRLTPNGAPGAQAAPNYYAGVFRLIAGILDPDDGIIKYDHVRIKIPNWSEWYEINATLRPYSYTGGTVHKYSQLYMDVEDNIFRVDGLNLNDAFEGQGVTPWLEMEIETAGIVAGSNGWIY